jgi:hypothetical protein
MQVLAARVFRFASVCALAACLGCGGGAGSLYSVKGTLKYTDGTPVKRAEIQLHADPARPNQPIPRGTVKDGVFEIETGVDKGAPAGKYKISIGNMPPETDPNKPVDPAEMDKIYVGRQYGDPETSGIPPFEVKSGDNEIPEIKIAPPAGQ